MLPNRFPYFCYHVLWDKKEKSTQININYTLEKEISMKKWNFYSNAFYLFIYFFIRFTYFNTVAQTFYILINSQEVSRKSRVSCTSILNLFFFFSSMYSNCICLYFSILHGPFFHDSFSMVCIYCTKRKPNFIYLNLLFLFNVILIYHNITRMDTLFFLIYAYVHALEISKFIIFTLSNIQLHHNCIINCGIFIIIIQVD